MSTKFVLTRDINGFNGFGLAFAQDGYSGVLVADAEQHVTVPDSYPWWIAIFSFTPGSNVWVDGITTAVVPSGSFSASTAELNPTARYVKAGDRMSFITSDTAGAEVGVKFLVAQPFGN